MPRHKTSLLLGVAVALAALAGFAYYANRSPLPVVPGTTGAGTAKAGGPPGGFAVVVETVKVANAPFPSDASAVGSLRSNESVILRPEISGRIEAIHFREGTPVTRGAVLVSLDASTQKAELQQAQANLGLAEANYRRTEELFQKKFVSARAKDEAAANLKVLEATVALAQAKYQKTQIRAPFSGIVGLRNVAMGDYVKEGQELINLEDVSTLKLDFRLPEGLLNRLQKGQTVEIGTDAMPGRTYKGEVDAIDPMLDQSGRAVALRARLPNPDLKLRPGMFVRVRLNFNGERQGLALPEQALVPAGNDNGVFRVTDGKAQRVAVKIGQRRGAVVEIVEGLKEGDEVVTAGQLKLRDGVAVSPVRADAAPATPASAATSSPPQAPLPADQPAKTGPKT